MTYTKNNWVDREGTTRYFETTDADGAKIFTPNYDEVTEIGTPVNANNMNHIEEGIEGCAIRKYNSSEVFEAKEWVTALIDGEKKIYQSLQDNNINHPVTDTDWWKKVTLGTTWEQAANAGMPSNRAITLSVGATGTTYTAPADGWFLITPVASENLSWCYLNNDAKVYRVSANSVVGAVATSLLPVAKGDVVSINYMNIAYFELFMFIYAEGAKEV